MKLNDVIQRVVINNKFKNQFINLHNRLVKKEYKIKRNVSFNDLDKIISFHNENFLDNIINNNYAGYEIKSYETLSGHTETLFIYLEDIDSEFIDTDTQEVITKEDYIQHVLYDSFVWQNSDSIKEDLIDGTISNGNCYDGFNSELHDVQVNNNIGKVNLTIKEIKHDDEWETKQLKLVANFVIKKTYVLFSFTISRVDDQDDKIHFSFRHKFEIKKTSCLNHNSILDFVLEIYHDSVAQICYAINETLPHLEVDHYFKTIDDLSYHAPFSQRFFSKVDVEQVPEYYKSQRKTFESSSIFLNKKMYKVFSDLRNTEGLYLVQSFSKNINELLAENDNRNSFFEKVNFIHTTQAGIYVVVPSEAYGGRSLSLYYLGDITEASNSLKKFLKTEYARPEPTSYFYKGLTK